MCTCASKSKWVLKDPQFSTDSTYPGSPDQEAQPHSQTTRMKTIQPYVVAMCLLVNAQIVLNSVSFGSPEEIDLNLDRAKDKLQANSGTYFKNLKRLVTNRDQIYLTISIPLPDLRTLLNLLSNKKLDNLKNTCKLLTRPDGTNLTYEVVFNNGYTVQNELIPDMCKVFDNIQKAYNQTLTRTRLLAAEKLRILWDYIPTMRTDIEAIIPQLTGTLSTDLPKNRKKRFIPLLMGGISLAMAGVQTGLSIYRTHKLRNRLKSLTKSVKYIANNQIKLNSVVLNIAKTISALAITTRSEVAKLHSQLNVTNNRLDLLTKAIRSNMMHITKVDRDQKNLALATSAQVNELLLLNTLNDLSLYSENMLEDLVTSFQSLQMGRLPPQLIDMTQLDLLLQELAHKLSIELPDYEIANTQSSEYYKQESVIWGIVDNTIIVNVPIIITERSSDPFELYEVQSFHVPTDIQEMNEHKNNREPSSYTRIMLDYTYLAVNKKIYLLLTESNLRDCDDIQGILYSKDLVIHVHRDSPSCLSVLYWQDKIDQVNRYCEVHYFHNIIPHPTVYEDSNNLLVINVGSDWRLACDNEVFPGPIKGMTYALIEKKAICACQLIIGKSYYIPRSITGCTPGLYPIKIKYPVNSLVLWNLRQIMENITDDLNYFKTQAEGFEYDVPDLKVTHLLDESKILYERPPVGVPFDKVVAMIRTNEVAYLTADDLILSESHIDKWFDNDSIENSIVFIGGLLGFVSLTTAVLIIVYVCVGKERLSAILASMTVMIHQQRTQALEPLMSSDKSPFPAEEKDPVFFEIKFRAAILIVMIISFLIFNIFKYVNNRYLKFRVYMPKPSNRDRDHKVHFYLEIFNENEKELLYLNSVRSSLLNLRVHSKTRVSVADYSQSCLFGQLSLSWEKGCYEVLSHEFPYPMVTSVSPFKTWKVQRMLRGPIHARTLILEDVFYSMESHAARRKTLVRNKIRTNGSLRSHDTDNEGTSIIPNPEWSMELEDFFPASATRDSNGNPVRDPVAMLGASSLPRSILSQSETTVVNLTPILPPRLSSLQPTTSKRVNFELNLPKYSREPTSPALEDSLSTLTDKFGRLRFTPLPQPESDT